MAKKQELKQGQIITAEDGTKILVVEKEVEKKKESKSGVGGCLGTIVIAILIIIGIRAYNTSQQDGVAANETPGVGTSNRPAGIGDTVTGDGLAITLNSASKSDTSGLFGGEEAGYEYMTINVTIRNVSTKTKDFNYLYWSAKDIDSGYTFDNALMAGDPTTMLSSGSLSPNDLVRGDVVIKIRKDSTHIRIKYDTSPIGGKNLYWGVRNN